ncbi:MAG: hypothetical protein WAL63_15615 [Solirubrobacteraceae bacterium]
MTTIHRISAGLALMLALAVLAAPAFARTFDLNANGSYVPSGAAGTQAKPSHSVSPPAVIVRVAAPGGFDWSDAGIGAAGGLALAMVGVGGAVAVSQSRARRTRRTNALHS